MGLVRLCIAKEKRMICEVSMTPFCEKYRCIHHIAIWRSIINMGEEAEIYEDFKKDKSDRLIECNCPHLLFNLHDLGKTYKSTIVD